MAISQERMRLTGTTHQPKDAENVIWHRVKSINHKKIRIYLDPLRLLKFIKKRERQIKLTRNLIGILPGPSIQIKYEALRHNPGEFETIYQFLGVDSMKARKPKLEKIVKESRQEIIENYEEIAAILGKTPYRVYFDEV